MLRPVVLLGLLVFGAQAAGAQPGPAAGPAPSPPGLTAAQRRELQVAGKEVGDAHDRLANLVSDCSGGNVMVRSCGPNPSVTSNECHEPLTTCEVVEAMRSAKDALDRIDKALGQ